jgi:hypothetical protein
MADKPFDIAVSFAGEDREFVEKVVRGLLRSVVRVFYDRFEQHDMLGRDLGRYLDQIYQHSAHFVAVFISKAYAEKAWTKHEFSSALAGKILGREDYILPILLDTTQIAGLPTTIGYVSAQGVNPAFIAEVLSKKISVSRIAADLAGGDSSRGITISLETYFALSSDVSGRRSYELDYLFTTINRVLVAAREATKHTLFLREQPGTMFREVMTYDFATRKQQHFKIQFPDVLQCKTERGDERWSEHCVREISAWVRVGYEEHTLPFRAEDITLTTYRDNKWSNLSQELSIIDSDKDSELTVQHARFGASKILEKPEDCERFQDFVITVDSQQFAATYTGEYFPGDFEDPASLHIGLAIYNVRAKSECGKGIIQLN